MKSRVVKLNKLGSKESGEVAIAMIMTLESFEAKTITYDKGFELAKHGFGGALLGSASYSGRPYSSWEEGSAVLNLFVWVAAVQVP
jgi:IS30 family transposase